MKRFNKIYNYRNTVSTSTTLFLKNGYDTNKTVVNRFITNYNKSNNNIEYQKLLDDFNHINSKYTKVVDYKIKRKNIISNKPKNKPTEYISVTRKEIYFTLLIDVLGWYTIYCVLHNA
nr:putative ankyrin repeat protein [Megavirus caiporensis]